jgi:Multiubiquitin
MSLQIERFLMADKKEHEFNITVNGRPRTVTSKELSFDEVVALAFDPVPTGEFIEITVAYRRGEGHKPEGTLSEGETVKVKDGTIFDVTATDKS